MMTHMKRRVGRAHSHRINRILDTPPENGVARRGRMRRWPFTTDEPRTNMFGKLYHQINEQRE